MFNHGFSNGFCNHGFTHNFCNHGFTHGFSHGFIAMVLLIVFVTMVFPMVFVTMVLLIIYVSMVLLMVFVLIVFVTMAFATLVLLMVFLIVLVTMVFLIVCGLVMYNCYDDVWIKLTMMQIDLQWNKCNRIMEMYFIKSLLHIKRLLHLIWWNSCREWQNSLKDLTQIKFMVNVDVFLRRLNKDRARTSCFQNSVGIKRCRKTSWIE